MLRIIVVHGRGEKPPERCKLGYVREVLTESVRRVDPRAGRWLTAHPHAIELAYYADLFRRFTHEASETCESFREPIDRLYEESRACPAWLRFRGWMLDRGIDATVAWATFLKPAQRKRFLSQQFADATRYFRHHAFASLLRERVQRLLVPALRRRDRVLLIAHSLGSVIAYDVLWKLSHMSEYAPLRGRAIEGFVTLGSPLGDRTIKTLLLGWRYRAAHRYPTNLKRWINLAARGDAISHDQRLANDFAPMTGTGALGRIEDHANLCTVYRSREGRWNPHKLYGYLILPEVGSVVAGLVPRGS